MDLPLCARPGLVGRVMVVDSGTPVARGLFFERPAYGARWFEWSVGYIRDNRLWYMRLRAKWPYLRPSYDKADEDGIKHLGKATLDLNLARDSLVTQGVPFQTLAGPVDFEENPPVDPYRAQRQLERMLPGADHRL